MPSCPVCKSGKTISIGGDARREPMMFCGACGHMWSVDRSRVKTPRSIFDVPVEDSVDQ